MYEQMVPEDFLFYTLYGAVAMLALTAAFYLLLRRGNVFGSEFMSSVRIRRWTAAFFAVAGVGHFYYLPLAFLTSTEAIRWSLMIGSAFDFLTFFPLTIIVMLAMLQDRRRPLWPPVVTMMPAIAGVVWCLVSGSDTLVPVIYIYLALLVIVIIAYLLYSLRQYDRWLRDNFADLEHKEVWQTFAVMAVLLSMLGFYTFASKGIIYEYIVQIGGGIVICFLLWRVETLTDLNAMLSQQLAEEETTAMEPTVPRNTATATEDYRDFSTLLQTHCIDTQLYLQYDLTAVELARAIGTNRTYLAQYFASQGLTYNAYINDLRIRHFVSLYHKAVTSHRIFTLQELSYETGYRSYSTFATAFRQHMGQTVTAWIRGGGGSDTMKKIAVFWGH